MNGTSAPIVPGNKEEQELKTYTVVVDGRFFLWMDVEAANKDEAINIAKLEANPADFEDWHVLNAEVQEDEE